jgi:hypothetical protein
MKIDEIARMEKSYREGIASYSGPESCVGDRKVVDEALTGEHSGWPLSREIQNPTPRCRRSSCMWKATSVRALSRVPTEPRAVEDPMHECNYSIRESGDPAFVRRTGCGGPHREVQGRTPMMHESRKSYSSIVPEKPPNKASSKEAAEAGEERELVKGNPPWCAILRTQSRIRMHDAQERVGHGAHKADEIPVRALWSYHPRQEPDAVVPHVRVCGGGRGRPRFLLRPKESKVIHDNCYRKSSLCRTQGPRLSEKIGELLRIREWPRPHDMLHSSRIDSP